MIELTQVKYCCDLDEGKEFAKEEKVILEKYVLDMKYEKVGGKDKFIIYYEDTDYNTSKFYLWQRIIINYVLSKGYKEVVFKINYVNLDIEKEKVFDKPVEYPDEKLLAGAYCHNCIKRKECSELKEAYLGNMHFEVDKGKPEQIFSALTMIQSRRKAMEETESQIKEILYEKIDNAPNKELPFPSMGIALSKKETLKDTLSYTEALKLGLVSDDTVNVLISMIKAKLKKDKILASKVKFSRAPFKTELDIKNI